MKFNPGNSRIFVAAFICLSAGLLASASLAADAPQSDNAQNVSAPAEFPEDRWRVGVAPYLWMSGIDGSVAQFGLPPIDIDLSFSDVLEDLEVALMMVVEAKRGRFGIFTDIIYSDISAKGSGPGGALTVKLDTQVFTGTGMLEYSIFEDGRSTLDVMAGARVWVVDTDATVKIGGPPGKFNDNATWADPMIGIKGRTNLSSSWYLIGWGMIGGAVSSDLAWDVFGGLGYNFNERYALMAGYRANSVDYKDGSFIYDVVMQGPVLGGVIRF